MNIQSLNVSATARVSIIPADALASGAYDLGNSRSGTAFDPVDQAFSIKAVDMTGIGVIDFADGTLTGQTTGTITGGAGKDADGEDVAFDKLLAIHLRNTGTSIIQIETNNATGASVPMPDIMLIPPGGDFLVTAPTADSFTAYDVSIFEKGGTGAISFELFALGKQ